MSYHNGIQINDVSTKSAMITWLSIHLSHWPNHGEPVMTLPDEYRWVLMGNLNPFYVIEPLKGQMDSAPFIRKDEWVPAPVMPAAHAPAMPVAPIMPEPVSRDVVLRHLGLRLSSWPTNIREAEGLFDCGGWLWTMINGLPTAYCPSKALHIHRGDWVRVVPTTALQPGERVEALDGEGVYEECITVGPHPHGTGEFVFITEAGMTFVSRTFRPVKTECEVVVSAALEHLGYDVTEFKFDGDTDHEVCASLVNLFKAGYLVNNNEQE